MQELTTFTGAVDQHDDLEEEVNGGGSSKAGGQLVAKVSGSGGG